MERVRFVAPPLQQAQQPLGPARKHRQPCLRSQFADCDHCGLRLDHHAGRGHGRTGRVSAFHGLRPARYGSVRFQSSRCRFPLGHHLLERLQQSPVGFGRTQTGLHRRRSGAASGHHVLFHHVRLGNPCLHGLRCAGPLRLLGRLQVVLQRFAAHRYARRLQCVHCLDPADFHGHCVARGPAATHHGHLLQAYGPRLSLHC